MTDTKRLDDATGTDSTTAIDPGLAEGRSKLILFVAMGALALGSLFETAPVVYGGVTLVVLAFALNTAGKLAHYRQLSIPVRNRVLLSLSWILLSLVVLGLLGTFVYARYGPGEAGFFWPLAVAGLGFGLLHMAAQSIYLSDVEANEYSETNA